MSNETITTGRPEHLRRPSFLEMERQREIVRRREPPYLARIESAKVEHQRISAEQESQRPQREYAERLFQELCKDSNPKALAEVKAARAVLAKAETDLAKAREALSAHSDARPLNGSGVPKWFGDRRALQEQVELYAEMKARTANVFNELAGDLHNDLMTRAAARHEEAVARHAEAQERFKQEIGEAKERLEASWRQTKSCGEVADRVRSEGARIFEA
jgi:hypothetical protein